MLHVLCGCGRRTRSRSVSVDDVKVVKGSVEGFNAWNSDLGLKSKLERRSKIGFNLHRSLGLEVHPHCAVSLLWLCHLADCRFLEIGRECTALSRCKYKQLVEHTCPKCTNTDLLKKFRKECWPGGKQLDWTLLACACEMEGDGDIPYHTLKLLLPYVGCDFAVDLSRT